MTAAHRTLPFDTRVRVFNRDNGRSTVVRINDRGPFVGNRIIDLSRAAARAIAMLGPGTARVRLTVTTASPLNTCSRVQVGAFSYRDNADMEAARLRRRGARATVQRGDDGLWRVFLGPYASPAESERVRARYGGLLKPC